MQPEEMLDRLLTERTAERARPRRGPVTSEWRRAPADPTLAPLLAAAARLDPLHDAGLYIHHQQRRVFRFVH